DAAAHRELADDLHAARPDRGHQVVEDPVGHRLVEGALVPVAPKIELERLELHAELVRNVVDPDRREVGLPGERAGARELRAIEPDLVVALGPRIRKGLDVFLRLAGHCLTVPRCRNTIFLAVHTTSAAGRLTLGPEWFHGRRPQPARRGQTERSSFTS